MPTCLRLEIAHTRVIMIDMKITTKKYTRRYPWEDWMALKEFTLTQGTDFNGRAYTMAQQIRTKVRKMGWPVSVNVEISNNGKSLRVRLLDKGP